MPNLFSIQVPISFNKGKNLLNKWGSLAIEWNLTPISHHMQKIKLKWIKDPNVRAKMIKHLFGNMGENLCDLGIDSGFLGHLKHKAIKKTIDKLNIKI